MKATFFTMAAGLLGLAAALPASSAVAHQSNATTPSEAEIDAIKAVPHSHFKTYATGGLIRGHVSNSTVDKRSCATSATFTWGDTDTGGPGILLTNADTDWRGFYIYANGCDSIPWKYVWINANSTEYVSVPLGFAGRIVRGTDDEMLAGNAVTLNTWFEITLDDSGTIWGDVSLIRGCDGSVLLWATDGGSAWDGFTQYILNGAPSDAYAEKPDGEWVLNQTENWDGSLNQDVINWEVQQVGAQYVYIEDGMSNPVIASSNGRFGTYWCPGRP